MTMLEKAARGAFERWKSGIDGNGIAQWDTLRDVIRDQWFAQARAVLAAIREPDERMTEAAFREACKHDNGDSAPAFEIGAAAFSAAIDAILSEKQE